MGYKKIRMDVLLEKMHALRYNLPTLDADVLSKLESYNAELMNNALG